MIPLKLATIIVCLIAAAWIDGHTIPTDGPIDQIVEQTICFEDQVVVVIVGVWNEIDHMSSGGPDDEMIGAVGCVAVDDLYDAFGPIEGMETIEEDR